MHDPLLFAEDLLKLVQWDVWQFANDHWMQLDEVRYTHPIQWRKRSQKGQKSRLTSLYTRVRFPKSSSSSCEPFFVVLPVSFDNILPIFLTALLGVAVIALVVEDDEGPSESLLLVIRGKSTVICLTTSRIPTWHAQWSIVRPSWIEPRVNYVWARQ